MSISYEEALSTLQAMFGETWTQEGLDTVLRHYQGHMENTVESLLGHGDKAPQLLLDKLKNGGDGNSTSDTTMDAQLAAQLSSRGGAASATPGAPPSTTTNNNSAGDSYMAGYTPRGTPTSLPDDFLRVDGGVRGATAAAGGNSQSTLDSDEALARMLQDELFSEELRRNPDFAHLAGRPRVGHATSNFQSGRSNFAARNTAGQQQQPQPLPNIMGKLSDMGMSAKFKLAQMAEQFKNNTNQLAAKVGGSNAAGGAGDQGASNAHSPREMRGLLDRDDNDAYELASRKDL